jgi:hypothetical protein
LDEPGAAPAIGARLEASDGASNAGQPTVRGSRRSERPALGALLAPLLAGIVNDALKTTVAFPRSDDVDVRVRAPGAAAPAPPEPRGAPGGFRSLPSREARAAVRTAPGACFGFPSGHVTADGLVEWILEAARWKDLRAAVLPAAALVLGGTLLGGIALGRRLGWYLTAPTGPAAPDRGAFVPVD